MKEFSFSIQGECITLSSRQLDDGLDVPQRVVKGLYGRSASHHENRGLDVQENLDLLAL